MLKINNNIIMLSVMYRSICLYVYVVGTVRDL